MNVYVITYPVPKKINQLVDINEVDFVIAVDQAIPYILKQQIKIDYAIGDFDSLKDLHMLENLNYKRLPIEKDQTDTFEALTFAYQMENVDQVYLLGGLGGKRFEHSYAHLLFLQQFKGLMLIDDQTTIQILKKGIYQTDFKGYISVFSIKPSMISLKGFKYPLDHYKLLPSDALGISNETLKTTATVEIHSGQIMFIITNK